MVIDSYDDTMIPLSESPSIPRSSEGGKRGSDSFGLLLKSIGLGYQDFSNSLLNNRVLETCLTEGFVYRISCAIISDALNRF